MTHTNPEILTDFTRLPEIYRLRCTAWENSPTPEGINFTNYPDGYRDNLEERSIHFVSQDAAGAFIGAARLSVVHSFAELPYRDVFEAYPHWPVERPFLFYSRLVIHPDHRGLGLTANFDQVRITYQITHGLPFAVATARPIRASALVRLGFIDLCGTVSSKDPCFHYENERVMIRLMKGHEQ
jgi:GNAT superfamily N-acetyltransferase